LVEDPSARCPRCQFEFLLEGPRGECPACGNAYMVLHIVDEGLKYYSEHIELEWEFSGEVKVQKSFKVVKNDRPDRCPRCSVEFEEVISWSDKFCIIRKKCLKCGVTDEEIIRKESQNAKD
jgi:hypothetical protein